MQAWDRNHTEHSFPPSSNFLQSEALVKNVQYHLTELICIVPEHSGGGRGLVAVQRMTGVDWEGGVAACCWCRIVWGLGVSGWSENKSDKKMDSVYLPLSVSKFRAPPSVRIVPREDFQGHMVEISRRSEEKSGGAMTLMCPALHHLSFTNIIIPPPEGIYSPSEQQVSSTI